MAKPPTDPQQLKARQLMVEAALDLTKLGRKLRRACILVLVHGYTNAEAASKIGGLKYGRQNVYRALKKVQPKLLEIEQYAKNYTANADAGS